MVHESRRYLGLELAGAKNTKTSLAVLEYYPAEKKIFLLDIFDRVMVREDQSADDALVELIGEFLAGASTALAPKMGVNVPLGLPPCIGCNRKTCPTPSSCNVNAVKWMRETNKRLLRGAERKLVREFTPYTQRPVELYVRYRVLPKLPPSHRFEVDETLGGNKGPLTARMDFLKRHLKSIEMMEVWPKLSVAMLALELGLQRRTVAGYRHLEEGTQAREEILETLIDRHDIFVYERDLRKLAANLPAFDAFICAYTALLADNGKCEKAPAGFPADSGWVQYPKI